ncbi:MAG: hypothetical protein HY013_02465, partial [Candidatus Solibacter usitatus]|nr:hypothetical protein [Candidatus Solibacter usitatus]
MRRRVLIGIVALLILLAASAALVLRGDWLREAIRRRILAEIERSTGGAASIGSFSFDWRRLRAEARDLVLRGTESPAAEPLLRVRELAVNLKIVSFWKQQVDLASLVVHEPAIHLIVHPDGSTNLPRPKLKEPTRNLAETLLDLAIGAFSIEKGLLVASGERMPFEARGENLVARFSFDPAGLQYRGEISVKHWRAGPVSLDLDAGLRMQKNRLEVSGLKLAMGKSRLEGSGALEDFAEPKARLEFRGHLNVPEVAALVKFGALRQGTAEIAGLARWDRSAGPSATASVTAGDLALRQGRLEIRGARVTSKVEADSRRIRFHSLEGEALGGRFTGRADVDNNFTRYRLEGELSQWNTARVLEAAGVRSAPWTGLASGSVQLQGDLRSRDVQADARLAIAPAPGSPPLEGALNLRYGRAQGSLELTRGYLATPATRLEFSGSVSSQLRVHAESKHLDDLLPALSLVSSEP